LKPAGGGFENFAQVVVASAREHAARPCLRFFRDGEWREWSYAEVFERSRRVAGGLVALGVEPGDRVAILSENRPEWVVADLGGVLAAAVVVSVYAGLLGEEMAYVVDHSEARVLFAENEQQVAKALAARELMPRLEHVVVMEGSAGDGDFVISLEALEALATEEAISARLDVALAQTPDDAMTLLYTSGTTGVPKGVVLTHGNIVRTVEASLEAIGGNRFRLEVGLRVLPLAHALERITGHFIVIYRGGVSAQVRGMDTIAADLRAIRPDFAPLVPRVYEKAYAAILARVGGMPALKRRIFAWALRVGTARSVLLERGEAVPPLVTLSYSVADRLVFREIREGFGGRIEFFGSGGAPLSVEVARFFHAAGIVVCEAWGATETTAPATTNTPERFRFGSVGRPLPGVEVKVAEDGELLVRGINVFREYFKDPTATGDAFDEDGFYRTGDVGRIDEDGFVYITDRKKELIITAAGKNIAPQKLENLLRERPFVSNALVHCDRRPYVVALVTLDRAALGVARPDLASAPADDPRIVSLIAHEVEAANGRLPRFEQIKHFRIVEREFSPETGELTLTLKLKRRVIEANYRDLLDGMYSSE
jgi:long-chain acyl-CoA synthetase